MAVMDPKVLRGAFRILIFGFLVVLAVLIWIICKI